MLFILLNLKDQIRTPTQDESVEQENEEVRFKNRQTKKQEQKTTASDEVRRTETTASDELTVSSGFCFLQYHSCPQRRWNRGD